MDFDEACATLRMSREKQLLAARVSEVFVDEGATDLHARILALYILDYVAKEIARTVDFEAGTVNKITQREQRRYDAAGKGTLALFVASHPKMLRWYSSGRGENGKPVDS